MTNGYIVVVSTRDGIEIQELKASDEATAKRYVADAIRKGYKASIESI
jgi:uncharacterized membrane protein YqiK